MAPTEVLASQHYENLSKIIVDNKIDIKVAFLSASITIKEKKDIKEKIKKGMIDIVIGTHAVITNDVEFNNLSMVIIDEQQRFGVNQRKMLEEKGDKVNIIHLSATPIPRTLSLMLFSGLDISKIDEKPDDRVSIKTAIIDAGSREKAYNLMLNEIDKGNRCYVVCPMIDEEKDEEIDNNYESVKEYAKKIDAYVSKMNKKEDVKIGILHGKMKQKEKDKTMKDFYNGDINVLVSTTVIEVGIDCKDATFMMIENAENYGLATLHQLRGRVGRSDKQSFCIFVDTLQSERSKERLQVLFDSNDGFYIADQDLKLRGAGDVFGIRQSGEMGFKIGDIYNDKKILEIALD
ncbi:MAG: DEAD/DEAH box helicase, partial [Lachnospiraceae bacterium]|nr:DEAD/DEAH box helicase [Lachnospiraceae bacterium]